MSVKFWSTTGTYGCFSNFSVHAVVIDRKRYKTTEHYYQAQKFATTDPLYANKIAKAPKARDAAKLGRDKKRKLLRRDWDSVKLNVMRKAIRAKAEQHADIKELLLSTENRQIVEDSPYDFYWGCGDDGTGENWLGRLWMELRGELRGDPKEEKAETDEEYVEELFSDEGPRSLKPIPPKVWNKRKGAPKPPKDAIYVGRPSRFGNPLVLEDERDRDEILVKYEKWLMEQPELIAAVKKHLKGKHLTCWCAPKACHADVLLRIANED